MKECFVDSCKNKFASDINIAQGTGQKQRVQVLFDPLLTKRVNQNDAYDCMHGSMLGFQTLKTVQPEIKVWVERQDAETTKGVHSKVRDRCRIKGERQV